MVQYSHQVYFCHLKFIQAASKIHSKAISSTFKIFHIADIIRDVISGPWFNFNSDLSRHPLKLGHGWVVTPADITLITKFMGPTWGQHGAHLGPVGPWWAPCRPHEPWYLGSGQFCGQRYSVWVCNYDVDNYVFMVTSEYDGTSRR